MNLPDFLIIGAARCGTSSLFANLCRHPIIEAPKGLAGNGKEAHFFDKKYKSHGLDWYKRLFRGKPDHLYFEATPNYLYDSRCPVLIKRHLPDAKFIVMLRNPIDRAWSHFWHWQRKAKWKWQDLHNPNHICIDKGIYHLQLRRWFEFFNPEQFMIIKSEHYYENENGILSAIFDWFNIERRVMDKPKYFDPVRPEIKSRKPYSEMPKGLRSKLEDFYGIHNLELEKLIGWKW